MIAIPACSPIATPRGSRDLDIGAAFLDGESASFFLFLFISSNESFLGASVLRIVDLELIFSVSSLAFLLSSFIISQSISSSCFCCSNNLFSSSFCCSINFFVHFVVLIIYFVHFVVLIIYYLHLIFL